MFWPAITGSGMSLLVTKMSGCGATIGVVVCAELLFCGVSMALVTVTVSVMVVLFGVPASTLTFRMIVTGLGLGTMSAVVAFTGPVPSTAGLPGSAVQPGAPDRSSETNFVLAGTTVSSETGPELLGPVLFTRMVYVITSPGVEGSLASVMLTETSVAAVMS